MIQTHCLPLRLRHPCSLSASASRSLTHLSGTADHDRALAGAVGNKVQPVEPGNQEVHRDRGCSAWDSLRQLQQRGLVRLSPVQLLPAHCFPCSAAAAAAAAGRLFEGCRPAALLRLVRRDRRGCTDWLGCTDRQAAAPRAHQRAQTSGRAGPRVRRVLRVAMVSIGFTRTAGIGLWGCLLDLMQRRTAARRHG